MIENVDVVTSVGNPEKLPPSHAQQAGCYYNNSNHYNNKNHNHNNYNYYVCRTKDAAY